MSTGALPQLYMRRPTLERLSPAKCPDGYSIRNYRVGDDVHWERIIAGSFRAELAKMSFERTMRQDPAFRPHRILFACWGDEPVGTASAYIRPAFMRGVGMVHYVGVVDAHGGRKLGSTLVASVLEVMRGEKWGGAWLSTDDNRLAAIRLYVALGFEPLLTHESHRERWLSVFDQIGQHELRSQFGPLLSGPVWSPPATPPDLGRYAERVQARRRWHAGRPSGTLGLDDATARDDESLHRPLALGAASASIASVPAGGDQPFEILYRAGAEPLAAGTEVRFYWPGQQTLGTDPQCRDMQVPGYVEVADMPDTASVEPMALGFRIVRGTLKPGDQVRLAVGRAGGFTWTPLAGRKNIDVIVDVGGQEPRRRLPEPVSIEVLPLDAVSLDIILPATAVPGRPVEVVVSSRDRYDNRVATDGPFELGSGAQTITAFLSRGLGRGVVRGMPAGVLRVRGTGAGTRGESNPCVPADGMQVYIGDLHAHDSCSQAEGYMHDVYAWARDEKRLDFLSLSVQCHHFIDNEKWFLAKQMAEAFLAEGRFVTFPAFEWQHAHFGDKIVHYLGGDMPYLPVDDPRYAHPASLYEALRGTDAVVISHHPGYETDLWVPGTDFEAMETDVDRCVELWSMHGSSEGYDPADRPLAGRRRESGVMGALRKGLRVGLLAGSDTHSGRPGGSAKEPRPYWGGLCAMWAEKLTRRSVFEALKARRTYALTRARIVLQFTVNGAPMGSELAMASAACIKADVWAPSPVARVEILKNADKWHVETGHGDETHLVRDDKLTAPAFYHCRVTLADGNLAVCSPVWVG